ncbi:THO complex subunit 1-like [Tropilaelaps mercedesae]|uniref:THO complex subunit 1-like n=1 Tax=Tropilaelaps mercedesae TaxID=418985 RepID=A0A1V9X2V3_9ACAR|nr:THO complex subunit 1-like [Tropilaelaps mercedesae]
MSTSQEDDQVDMVDSDANTRGNLQNNNSSNRNNNKDRREIEPPQKRTRLAVMSQLATASTEASDAATLSASAISRLAAALGADCARLVPHMGLSDDELQYVQSQHEDDPVAQANHLLTLWKENEPQDATLEKARQIAAKLGLIHKLTDELLKD